MDNNGYKVGSRVEVYTEWQGRLGWWLGRIIGVTRTGTHWQVRLDVETRPYTHVAIAGDESATKLRHSNAPLPKAQPSQRAGYMPEGELARQLEAAKQFKVRDHIALRFPQDSDEQIGTIVEMDSKSFLFQPDNGAARGYFLNALAFARKIDTPDPEPRKSYEFKIGDRVEVFTFPTLDSDSREWVPGVIASESDTFNKPAWRINLDNGTMAIEAKYDPDRIWIRPAMTLSDRVTNLSLRADQLDDQIARLMDERARIDRTLSALRAISEDSASEL